MYEQFDTLKQIYAGNAATKPLPFGISTNSDHQHDNCDDEDDAETSEAGDVDMNVTLGETPLTRHGKRKAVDQSVKLIDSKRGHMERHLSSSRRGQGRSTISKGYVRSNKTIKRVVYDLHE